MAYTPGPPPQEISALSGYIQQELLQLSAALRMVEEGVFLRVLHEEPAKPREGQLAIAAGSPSWDPGGGKGLYERRDGLWEKL